MSNQNPINLSAVILAENTILGIPGSESQLRKLISTVGIGQDIHDIIRATLGEVRYKMVA